MAQPSTKDADAIVVLGHRPARDDHGVEYETRARVERGLTLFHTGAAPRLIFSGGRGTHGESEADVMAEYAIARGIAAQVIVRESRSRDTIENARFSVALLHTLVGRARPPRILLVTSAYHVKRAAKLFRCAGAEVEAVPVPLELSWGARMARHMREALVRVVYWFTDECTRAKLQ